MQTELALEVKRITKVKGESTLKAFCDVAISEALLIKGLKVVDGKNGLFVSMPSERGKNGQWYDSIVPLNKDVRDRLSQIVLEAYETDGESHG